MPTEPEPGAPSEATLRYLVQAQERLAGFPEVCRKAALTHGALGGVLREYEALGREVKVRLLEMQPWFRTFTGSTLLLEVALKSADELGEIVDLHLTRGHEDPALILPFLYRPVETFATRLLGVVQVLPGHIELGREVAQGEKGLLERVRLLPKPLRQRFWRGTALAVMLLAPVALLFVAVAYRPLWNLLGLGTLLTRYVPSSVGIIAVLFFFGARLLWGSVWLAKAINIPREYEAAKRRETTADIEAHERRNLRRFGPE